jgi:hypothetical protein
VFQYLSVLLNSILSNSYSSPVSTLNITNNLQFAIKCSLCNTFSLCIAADGDVSQMPSVPNGTNKYSTAMAISTDIFFNRSQKRNNRDEQIY